MEPIQIYLNSQYADYFFNGASDCEYVLPLIEISDEFHIYVSVVSCLISYSFYKINGSNNILKYSFDGVTINTLIFPIGSYSVNNLVTVIKSKLLSNFSHILLH